MKPKVPYCVWVGEMKWLGNMKKWQAYYLAFHLWIVLRLASNKTEIKIAKES